MTTHTTFDFDFQPDTYWETEAAIYANIKGELRRRLIQKGTDLERLAQAPEFVFADSLPFVQRSIAGSIHPSFMGGEYPLDHTSSHSQPCDSTL